MAHLVGLIMRRAGGDASVTRWLITPHQADLSGVTHQRPVREYAPFGAACLNSHNAGHCHHSPKVRKGLLLQQDLFDQLLFCLILARYQLILTGDIAQTIVASWSVRLRNRCAIMEG